MNKPIDFEPRSEQPKQGARGLGHDFGQAEMAADNFGASEDPMPLGEVSKLNFTDLYEIQRRHDEARGTLGKVIDIFRYLGR